MVDEKIEQNLDGERDRDREGEQKRRRSDCEKPKKNKADERERNRGKWKRPWMGDDHGWETIIDVKKTVAFKKDDVRTDMLVARNREQRTWPLKEWRRKRKGQEKQPGASRSK